MKPQARLHPPHRQSDAAGRPPYAPAGAALLVGLNGGYFGAAAAALMLAVLALSLSLSASEPLPVTNTVKNITTGAANVTATVAYAFPAPAQRAATAALGRGLGLGRLVGSRLGPVVVRRLPEQPPRIGLALAGLGLAESLRC
ncbi:TSUP family transporter [Streptomyces cavernicola]|uniref:Probable membrane transporter protein n=1 Tax=Streptomyces cavernicola TaxID=3043613 RepID=A0ABT6SDA3_9ACTN|nr:TSUP family transporter [Streptomyces sp. B-S-A6]MDI3406172.1 TSUP family transporter [Streptomyces sp. B-S-A6]